MKYVWLASLAVFPFLYATCTNNVSSNSSKNEKHTIPLTDGIFHGSGRLVTQDCGTRPYVHLPFCCDLAGQYALYIWPSKSYLFYSFFPKASYQFWLYLVQFWSSRQKTFSEINSLQIMTGSPFSSATIMRGPLRLWVKDPFHRRHVFWRRIVSES